MNAHWSPQQLCPTPGCVVCSDRGRGIYAAWENSSFFFFFLVECVEIHGRENKDFC